jgi:hypothetical protein
MKIASRDDAGNFACVDLVRTGIADDYIRIREEWRKKNIPGEYWIRTAGFQGSPPGESPRAEPKPGPTD